MALEGAGYSTTGCGTAEEARSIFKTNQFDLLLVDIGLPDVNGLDLVRELGLKPRGDIPFIFLTAASDLNTRMKCFQIGAQDYITKPFAIDELLARVRVHLELKNFRDDLSRRNYELELRNRVRQDLTDMLIHDLKTPLSSIKGTLDLAMKRGMISEPAYQKLVTSAGAAADFMLLMLNDILDLARAEQAGLEATIEPVNLEGLLTKLQVLFAPNCRTREVTLETRFTPEVATIQTDANFLFRILVNLVANALRHSPQGQSVVLEASLESGRPRFTVADRGPGIPDHLKGRLFEKYATGAPRQGSGIGLAFSRLAAHALSGDIRVEDRTDGGTLFVVLLPTDSLAH
jgi:signal transduction histidine kinase